MEPKLTPAMQQYMDMKQQYSDCILLFRLGDFYEVFFDDAKLCAKLLDLVLTARNKQSDDPIPMAGMPYHSAEKYIAKLVKLGYKVALAEQMTEPKPGQVVERKVTAVYTPGTYVPESHKDYAYIFAITETLLQGNAHYHCARGDVTLGEYTTHNVQTLHGLEKILQTVKPSEILLSADFSEKDAIRQCVCTRKGLVSLKDIPHEHEKLLQRVCGVQTLASFGVAVQEGRGAALAMLLAYMQHTQQSESLPITRIASYDIEHFVKIDDITIKNLEIFQSSYEAQETYSLCGVIDTTKTAPGGRLLRYFLRHPSNEIDVMQKRSAHIQKYVATVSHTLSLQQKIEHVHDTMRLASAIVYKKPLPVLFAKLRSTYKYATDEQISNELLYLGVEQKSLTAVNELYHELCATFVDDEQLNNESDYIRDGYNKEIDELRNVAFHSDDILLQYQQELVKHAGVSQVKVKYILNQGYFLEVTSKDIAAFEASFLPGDDKFGLLRRSTLKGAQRYVSPYLDHLQGTIMSAKSQLATHEQAVLRTMQQKMQTYAAAIAVVADYLAQLDVYTSFALVAHEKEFVQPTLTENNEIHIVGGRHPVIEKFLPRDEHFIPNDIKIGTDESLIHIITGPNMGGKSTFLRQNALIVLLAHCGFRVPAQAATIGIVDGIFARVGSGDIIAKNQSTFMTEMIEVANILHNATSKSFVIFDELGRGTSTYDGLALTQAILSYIAEKLQCKTVIATHYHELIALDQQYNSVKNFSVSVYETDTNVVFLKKIVPGGADKSYGIDVAKIAGIPQPILEDARHKLYTLTEKKEHTGQQSDGLFIPTSVSGVSHTDTQRKKIETLIESYNCNEMTPLQALQLVVKLQEEVKKVK